mmetsp:Transcript_66072/g.190662  ORF Transcript_66072/g.190662 Transcript_66072/m.190662 type:complete len:267 (+) Transcript_66072:316-1116(+)
MDAELDELRDGVLLHVVVACLSEHEHLVVGGLAVAEVLAVLPGLQLHDPNALARGAAILLHHAGLERDRSLEARRELFGAEVGLCVLEPKVHALDHAQRFLYAHLGHGIRGGPNGPRLRQLHHVLVELPLVAAGRGDLPRVAPNDDCIEGPQGLEELLVPILVVAEQVAAHARLPDALGDGDRVEAMAINGLVATAAGQRGHIDLHQRRPKRRRLCAMVSTPRPLWLGLHQQHIARIGDRRGRGNGDRSARHRGWRLWQPTNAIAR